MTGPASLTGRSGSVKRKLSRRPGGRARAIAASLKGAAPGSEGAGMGMPDLACPICDADLIFAGDERVGELVYCTFCGAPFVLRARPKRDDDDEAAFELEADD